MVKKGHFLKKGVWGNLNVIYMPTYHFKNGGLGGFGGRFLPPKWGVGGTLTSTLVPTLLETVAQDQAKI